MHVRAKCMDAEAIPMAMGVAKVQSLNRSIRNVIIRNVVADVVPTIVAEVKCVHGWVELHSNNIPDACSSAQAFN